MKIRKVNKPVYITSDGTHFGNEHEAKKHEFEQWYDRNKITGVEPREVSQWLRNNKNAILEHIGTTFDPETEEATKEEA